MNFETMSVSNQQRGAVLIFSLVMLLLLTLASVSMIQQNKQELAMTGNTLDQTVALARAETGLRLAEQAIDAARLDPDNPNSRQCNASPESKLDGNWVFSDDPVTGQAKITAVYCLRSLGAGAQCPFTEDGERDLGDANCNCESTGGTEIYTIKWTSNAGSNYGAQRTVESKYAVNCINGSF